jgi:hypothetical protein
MMMSFPIMAIAVADLYQYSTWMLLANPTTKEDNPLRREEKCTSIRTSRRCMFTALLYAAARCPVYHSSCSIFLVSLTELIGFKMRSWFPATST